MRGIKIDATVKKETIYIGIFTFVLSVLMQAVFIFISKWDYTVLLGNLLGFLAAVGNFLLLGLTVQIAVEKDEAEAKKLIKTSQSARLFLLLIIALIGHIIPVFNTFAVVIPYLFPRIAIAVRPAIKNF